MKSHMTLSALPIGTTDVLRVTADMSFIFNVSGMTVKNLTKGYYNYRGLAILQIF